MATSKKKALGRGLDSLFPDAMNAIKPPEAAPASAAGAGTTSLPISSIEMNPFQPRRAFDDDKLSEMAASIKERGILQPVLVRLVPRGYQLVAGERRLRAAKLIGMTQIPCQIVSVNDEQCLEYSLVENLQRENLNPIEEARGYDELINRFGLTQEEASARVGKDRSTVTNSLRLLKLPATMIEDLEMGRLSPGHARALLSLEDNKMQARLWAMIVERGLSVREAEIVAHDMKEKKAAPKKKARALPPDILELEERIMATLGTRVQIRPTTKTAGKIIIQYTNLEDMDRILEAMGVDQGK